MSTKTNALLSLYRTYENLVREAGRDPKDLEAGMDGVLSSEMTLIRQFRNFLSHTEDPGFLEPTDKMLAVLEKQVKEWTMKGDVVKKHVKSASVSICSGSDTCADAVGRFCKLKLTRLPVVIDGDVRICELHSVAPLALENKRAKLSAVKLSREKPVFVRPDEPMSGIDPDRVNVCTQDGTPSGKILGLVVI